MALWMPEFIMLSAIFIIILAVVVGVLNDKMSNLNDELKYQKEMADSRAREFREGFHDICREVSNFKYDMNKKVEAEAMAQLELIGQKYADTADDLVEFYEALLVVDEKTEVIWESVCPEEFPYSLENAARHRIFDKELHDDCGISD